MARGAKRSFVRLRRKQTPLGAVSRRVKAALLCVDVATNAGWALYLAGRLHAYGEADSSQPSQRRRVCIEAFTSARVRDLPLAMALEVPFGGYLSAALALHANVVQWRETWSALGLRPGRIIELTANQWRKPLFGRRTLARAAARALEAQLALQVAANDGALTSWNLPGPDASAAICCGQSLIRASLLAQTVADL